MNFEGLKSRVERTERLVEGRLEQTQVRASALKATWRESWTPTRILAVGLISGFLVGRAEPARAIGKIGKLGGPRWIQLATAVSGLLTSLQAAMAAATAKDAAETADQAAEDADDNADAVAETAGEPRDGEVAPSLSAEVDGVSPADRRRRPDPAWETQPRPAEAATEISER